MQEDPATSRERGYAREILINHIRQFRANAAERRVTPLDPPPSYEDVVKVTPSYESTSAPSYESTTANDRMTSAAVDADIFDDAGSQPPSYFEAVASMTSQNDCVVVSNNVITVADVSPTLKSDEQNIKRCEGITTIHIE